LQDESCESYLAWIQLVATTNFKQLWDVAYLITRALSRGRGRPRPKLFVTRCQYASVRYHTIHFSNCFVFREWDEKFFSPTSKYSGHH